MISLRHNNFWPALMLVFALVFAAGASPAVALACVVQDAPAGMIQGAAGPAAQVGRTMSGPRPCCCGPKSGAAAAGKASGQPTAHKLGQSGCGCSVKAPPVPPPADAKTAVLVLVPGLAVLPDSPVVLQRPVAGSSWAVAPTAGSPRTPYNSSGPSRAPPAC